MKPAIIQRLHKNFEDYVNMQDGVEFWFARDLQKLLGYTQWRNLLNVIEKAKESCKNSNHEISDHFADVSKMVVLGRRVPKTLLLLKVEEHCRFFFCLKSDDFRHSDDLSHVVAPPQPEPLKGLNSKTSSSHVSCFQHSTSLK